MRAGSIFGSLRYVRLYEPDEFAALNGGFVVYHDDFGDYSTNEPIMDGTANLAYLLSALAPGAREQGIKEWRTGNGEGWSWSRVPSPVA